MSDRIFADTNILVYSIANDPQKRIIADAILLNLDIVVSPQVMSEFVAVSIRKQILPQPRAITYATQFMQVFDVTALTKHTVPSAFDIMTRYQFPIGIASSLRRRWKVSVRGCILKICKTGNRLKRRSPFTILSCIHDRCDRLHKNMHLQEDNMLLIWRVSLCTRFGVVKQALVFLQGLTDG